jgi:hypothetical protein
VGYDGLTDFKRSSRAINEGAPSHRSVDEDDNAATSRHASTTP